MADSVTFATSAAAGEPWHSCALLARSLRRFGGGLSRSRALVFARPSSEGPSPSARRALDAAGTELVGYDMPPGPAALPYAELAFAAAAAEECCEWQSETLVWMAADTLVLREPLALRLEGGKALGYRPVHHRLIGSLWDEPADPFWSLIYEHCGVTERHLFAMPTCTEAEPIRPYFNAGLLVVRPERGILRAWRDELLRLSRLPDWDPFFADGWRHRVFFHQAVLAGAVLSRVDRVELQLLPPSVNYPLNLHESVPRAWRPRSLDELTTARYDDLRETAWRTTLPASPALRSWLEPQLAEARADA